MRRRGSHLASRFLADRAVRCRARVDVDQNAGISLEMACQKPFDLLGFPVGAVKVQVPGKDQVQVDMDVVTSLPGPELVDVDPFFFSMSG